MSGVSLKLFPGESFEGIRFPDAVIPVAVSPKISYPEVLKPVFEFMPDTVFTEGLVLRKRPGKCGRVRGNGGCRFGCIFPVAVVLG